MHALPTNTLAVAITVHLAVSLPLLVTLSIICCCSALCQVLTVAECEVESRVAQLQSVQNSAGLLCVRFLHLASAVHSV